MKSFRVSVLRGITLCLGMLRPQRRDIVGRRHSSPVFTSGTTPATNEISSRDAFADPHHFRGGCLRNQVNFTIPKSHRTGRLPLVLHAAFFTADGNYVVGIDDEDVLFNVSENAELGRILMTPTQPPQKS